MLGGLVEGEPLRCRVWRLADGHDGHNALPLHRASRRVRRAHVKVVVVG
jgi:hypothetical protein